MDFIEIDERVVFVVVFHLATLLKMSASSSLLSIVCCCKFKSSRQVTNLAFLFLLHNFKIAINPRQRVKDYKKQVTQQNG